MKKRRTENCTPSIDQHIRKSRFPTEDEKLMNLIGKSICCAEENDDKKSLPLPTAEEGMLRKKQSCEHRKNAKLEHMRALTL
jgi:hypothetical protein